MEKEKITENKALNIKKERVLSDAELLKEGAEYKLNKGGEGLSLELTKEQMSEANKEMEADLEEREKTRLENARENLKKTVKNKEDLLRKETGELSGEERHYMALLDKISLQTHELGELIGKGKVDIDDQEKLKSSINDLHKTTRDVFVEKLGIERVRELDTAWRADLKQRTAKKIKEVSNFDDLDIYISRIGGAQGSQQFFTPEKLKAIIGRVREKKLDTSFITNSFGIRDKVIELLELEKDSKDSKKEENSAVENPEKKEASMETVSENEDINDFVKYADKYQADINAAIQQGVDLEEFFYGNFYSRNIENIKYDESDPSFDRFRKAYAEFLKKEEESISKDKGDISVAKHNYWFYCRVNRGLQSDENIGRVYLNIEPKNVLFIFKQILKKAKDEGLHIETKIPKHGNAKAFNRLDKMVVYFNSNEGKKIKKILEEIYDSEKEMFDDTGIPRFTAEVKNKEGEVMNGIGFAEEPKIERTSFGQIRSKILEEVYLAARASGYSVIDPEFNLNRAFSEACKRYEVDPDSPAFNISGNQIIFSEFREGGLNSFGEKESREERFKRLDKYLEKRIPESKSIEELVMIVYNVGNFKVSPEDFKIGNHITDLKSYEKEFNAEEFSKQILRNIWKGRKNISGITNMYGLKDKVIELLRGSTPILLSEENELEGVKREISDKIEKAESLDELLKSIRGYAGLVNKRGVSFTFREIMSAVAYATKHPDEGEIRFRYITRSYGLRDKVKELVK